MDEEEKDENQEAEGEATTGNNMDEGTTSGEGGGASGEAP
jgi:hypothetical protein